MPTEVLVMCTACGRPQAAGGARCIACGAPLPEAPLPAPPPADVPPPAPPGPFLTADLGGGRQLVGEAGRLSYRMAEGVSPRVVELVHLRALTLESRPFLEALMLCGFGALGAVTSVLVLKVVAFGLTALGVLLAAVCRVHTLVLETSTGGTTRWSLGLARRGSERDARLLQAWRTLASAVKARGVVVTDADGRPVDGPHA
nr:zinc ribbon domain-containing protein [Myxococcus sp. MH1]